MTKKCIYCKSEISDDRSLDICNTCGVKVWGGKMFNAILQNMENAREKGDLCNSNLSMSELPSKFGSARISFG
ncbi:MAG: hypothetical protein ABIE36_01655 [Candidatus Diapherotrites archaeon]